MRIVVDDTPRAFDVLVPDELAWWTPTIGPSCTLLMPILARSTEVALGDIGFMLGLHEGLLKKSLKRLEVFHFVATRFDAQADDTALVVKRFVPLLTPWMLSKCPDWFVAQYDAAVVAKTERSA